MKEQKILVILSVILIVFILFSASFFMVLTDKSFYNKNSDNQEDQNTTRYLIKYLTSANTEINEIKELSLFLPEEKSHLKDVKSIISWLKALSIAALILLLVFIMRLKELKDFRANIKRIFTYGGIATLAVLVIIFVLSLNFPAFFDMFHKILFPHGNYSFPMDYLLIQMFPQEFFYAFARKMFFHTGILSLISLFLGSSSALAVRNTRHN